MAASTDDAVDSGTDLATAKGVQAWDALSDVSDDELLQVNKDFAAKLEKSGKLAQSQRRKAKFAGIGLPSSIISLVNRECKKALAFERMKLLRKKKAASSPEEEAKIGATMDALKALPASVAAECTAQRLGVPWPRSSDAGRSGWDALDDDVRVRAQTRLSSNKHVQDACKTLIKAARKAAFASGGGPSTGAAAAARPASAPVVGAKRARPAAESSEVESHGDAARSVDRAALGSATKHPEPSAAKRSRLDPAHADGPADGGRSAEAKQTKPPRERKGHMVFEHVDCAELRYPAQDTWPPVRQPAPGGGPLAAACDTHVHGRGAGKGRGLHPLTGEPRFDDMHPSWQAKRRASARQGKAVHRALREPPAPAVEVPLAAAAGAPLAAV
jgi:hypothetical protein